MSLRQEIETWVAALAAYDNTEFDSALRCFEQIADTSKILFNCGVIYATLGEHGKAVVCYQRAIQLDQYLAIAYFQQGVSNFLLGDFEEALANFNDTLLYLRGNNSIDYEQLGLKFKLYSCEVLFNRGLCYIYLQQKQVGMHDLVYASHEKVVADHDVIDEAIREQAEGYTVFSIPVGVVYRPNAAKVKNLKAKDYLGKARLVAAQSDTFASDPRRQAALAASSIDRTDNTSSYAAANLVRPELRSRARQQSEPPLQRHMFPPTPPPESERDRPESHHSRRRSNESLSASDRSSLQASRPAAKPLRLELGVAAFEHKASMQQKTLSQSDSKTLQDSQSELSNVASSSRSRFGAKRSESERPPAVRRDLSGGPSRANGSNSDQYRRREHPSRTSYRSTVTEATIEEDPIEAYSQQVTDLQNHSKQQQRVPLHYSRSSASSRAHLSHPQAIEEEDEQPQAQAQSDATLPPLAFEIVPAASPNSTTDQRSPQNDHPPGPSNSSHGFGTNSSSFAYSPRSPPAPALRRVRIKLHAEDMRFVMTTPETPFDVLMEQIRVKFAFPLSPAFKLKIKDEEGDLVTMADQDDWDMALASCRAQAAKEGSDLGKLEMWVQQI